MRKLLDGHEVYLLYEKVSVDWLAVADTGTSGQTPVGALVTWQRCRREDHILGPRAIW
jgi:hypothetical protein